MDLVFKHESSFDLDRQRSITPSEIKGIERHDSQLEYADTCQTVIVFDWDDTLFPTSYVNDDLGLDWRLPLNSQPNLYGAALDEFVAQLQVCETQAEELLRVSRQGGHVVVVTLATSGWVELACENFYRKVGALMWEENIPVIYAQERSRLKDMPKFQSNADAVKYWGIVKGKAISEEVDSFYTQYKGQSWKNILSVGDSIIERYGLLAATSAYMRGHRLRSQEVIEEDVRPFSPIEHDAWTRVGEDGHITKLRVKCCKLVDRPVLDEVIVQLGMVTKWLGPMLQLDDCFDLDIDCVVDDAQLDTIEAVLRGDLPTSELPRRPPEGNEGASV